MEGTKAFDSKEFVRKGFSVSEVVELKETFDLFDPDHSGFVDPQVMNSALRALGFEEKNQKIYELLNGLEKDSPAKIDFSKFLDALQGSLTINDTENEANKIFSLFDYNNSGCITYNHINKVARELGENLTGEEINKIIEKADSDGDSQLTKEDFQRIMSN